MKTTLFCVAMLAGAPAFAQQMDHSKMHHPVPEAKPTETKSVEKQEAATPVDHSQMDLSTMNHDMPGMDMSQMDHSQMNHAMPQTQSASKQPRTPIPAITDADRAAAAPPSRHMHHLDNSVHSYTLINRLETWDADHGNAQAWEAQGWIGTDLNRLWWRSEGEREDGATEAADLEVSYGRSVSRWWDVVAGVRHDFKPGDAQTFVGIGVQGLAPQKFEVSAMGYAGEHGQTAARFEVEYETLLSNRLVLQPLVEAALYGKDDPRRGIGSGLSTVETGLRLRYEFTRQFAPYIGIVHERAFGKTAELRQAEGESARDTRFVFGLRMWF